MTHAYLNGKSSKKFIVPVGAMSPALSSSRRNKDSRREAKILAGARAAYSSMMNGLAEFDTGTFKLRAKCLQLAEAVIDAAQRVEDHFP